MAARVDRAARAFGLLDRAPGEAPDLEVNRALLKLTSGVLGRADAKCDGAETDPAVVRGLLKALAATSSAARAARNSPL